VIAAAARLEQKLEALRGRADRWQVRARTYRDQVEHRFGPLLAELGLPVRQARRRKPVRKATRKAGQRRV
jgi:hypothetical protein